MSSVGRGLLTEEAEAESESESTGIPMRVAMGDALVRLRRAENARRVAADFVYISGRCLVKRWGG